MTGRRRTHRRGGLRKVEVSVQEYGDVVLAGLQGDGQRRAAVLTWTHTRTKVSGTRSGRVGAEERDDAYVISECGVTARHRQQLAHNVHMTVFTGAHERRGAVVVPDVDLSPAGQEGPYHVPPAVANGEHQRCLPRLHTGTHMLF